MSAPCRGCGETAATIESTVCQGGLAHDFSADPETCPVCGQPDNCGDCDHTPAGVER